MARALVRSVASVMCVSAPMSTTIMSASAPAASRPFDGRRNRAAAFPERSADARSMGILPAATASRSVGTSVSSPGWPGGAVRKSPSFAAFSSGAKAAWSVVTWASVPSASASHSAARSASCRTGGLIRAQTPARATSSSVKDR
jgi:hypothetical protein